ncbi:hypothetical protein J2X31_003090 [Flavobacterium arsenatis]|uniref:Lipocalin-like domain-containing protein n=1 Tax=Flavobacterium arsenatis TaxID=1484332 RepID=A0ABU1TT58_9FLAO|nr:lipocalin family protein [Flavobacterium arsenatis]MDR6969064.1 hypothetical protein [Flavobacterium arsenatis]
MKKIKLFTALLITTLLFSCSSDDNGGSTTSGDLLGKWYNKEYIISGQTFPYDDHEECGKDYIQFNSDGTGASVDVWDCEEDVAPFTYTRSGNTITVTSDGESDTVQITELSSTTLKVKISYDFNEDGTDEEVIEVYTRN